METPSELKYSREHEWVRLEEDLATVGVTDFAQDQLGDIVYLDLPRIGTTVEQAEKGLILRTLEFTKNNKTRAAEVLGISLKTLHNKLKEYGRDTP